MGKTLQKIDLKERLLKKVKKTNTCWLWDATLHPDGYGEMWYPPTKKMILAHRLSYLLFNGDIPKNKLVCHSCDIRNCVNPEHLWLGSNQDNLIDASKKKRIKGQKLSLEDVYKIRDFAKKGLTHEKIAENFSVSRATVTRVINRSIYKYV